MKQWILACMCSLVGMNAAWAAAEPADAQQPSVAVYITKEKYEHPLRIGLLPYYSHWVSQGVVAEKAALPVLRKHFANTEVCDAGRVADIIVWIKPRLIYNPGVGKYYAMLKVQFHLGDGRSLATYKSVGEQDGDMGSIYVDETIEQAFDRAMASIETQFVNDAALQQAFSTALGKDFTRSPCGMVSIFGRSPTEE